MRSKRSRISIEGAPDYDLHRGRAKLMRVDKVASSISNTGLDDSALARYAPSFYLDKVPPLAPRFVLRYSLK